MSYSRGRPAAGPSVISMLSERYKEPDNARSTPAGAGKTRILFGQPGGGPGKTITQQRTEETTYSFSQEEEVKQDGRTVYKTREEKSFSEKPKPWPGDSAAEPAPKVSVKTITLSTKSKSDGQPIQLTNDFGGLQRQTITTAAGQPQRQDYHYQQTVSTTSQYERGTVPQQQQPVYLQQQQRTYTIQQQPSHQQKQQQLSYQQKQQPSYAQQQQQQQQQLSYQQQQQPSYQQKQQPSYAQQQQQQQPSYQQQQQTKFQQQQQFSYQQQQQPSYQPQQQPSYAPQQPSYAPQQQQPKYGQQPQQQQPKYGQQPQQQQPKYGQQPQQQQPKYGQQPQQQQPKYGQQPQQQQPKYGQQPQQQQPKYGQQPPPQQQQQQQPTYAQQKPTYQQQQPQQQKPTYQQQQQQPQQQRSFAPQQPTYQPQPQQRPSYQQQQPQPQPQQQQQVSYQQQQKQQISYQQQQQRQQPQQRPGYQQQPPPQQPQYQQPVAVQQSVSTVRSSTYGQGQPSVATITTITTTTSSNARYPWEDEPEEGVHENEPEQRPDLVRESDKDWAAELPSTGLARNLKEKFLTGQLENRPATFKKEITPPGMAGGGVFENQPLYNPDVVHYGEETEREALPERGATRSMAARFKQMERQGPALGSTPGKREITPDRTTRVEYVSEPRGFVEKYEGRPESGVFESEPVYMPDVVKADEYEDDRLPERGLARNIADHFRAVGSFRPPPSPSRLKEFTPPREEGTLLQGYGVYESLPQYDPTVVHAEDQQHDILPERGMARTIVTRFRKMSAGDLTPKSPRVKKEFTPPRDGGGVYENTPTEFIPDYNRRPESGVIENQPQVRYDVVRGDEPPLFEVELPERGMARSLMSTWRQKEYGSSQMTPTSSGKPKEFTPPREEPRVLVYRTGPRTPGSAGYEGFGGFELTDGSVHPYDLPGQYQPLAEASVFESEPVVLDDVVREADTDWMEGMPRSDTTKKMVARFRHIQQQAATGDYTPPPSSRPPLPGRQAQNIRY